MMNDTSHGVGAAWADYDRDGWLDLFVANAGEDPDAVTERDNYLYRNNGNTNRWLMIRLVGTVSNRSAIGAKVRLKTNIGGRTLWQLREISGGSGFCSQNDPRAHFGLGDATNAEILRIEWPSGTVQERRNVAVNQILTVTEPPRLQAVGRLPDGAFQFELTGGVGFRYALESSRPSYHPPHEPQDRPLDYQPLAHLEVSGVQCANSSGNSHPGPLPSDGRGCPKDG
jgi:hypothetical protein